LVFALTPAAREVDAAFVFAFTLAVPAAIAEPRDEDAVSVCALTAEVMPAVAEFVFAFTPAATDEEAF
jgi:hypothetical protein